MSLTWDYDVDYLIVGTGVAGLSAAITAKRHGLETLIVESMGKWGGTTAISGGGLWMPGNPLMMQVAGQTRRHQQADEYRGFQCDGTA